MDDFRLQLLRKAVPRLNDRLKISVNRGHQATFDVSHLQRIRSVWRRAVIASARSIGLSVQVIRGFESRGREIDNAIKFLAQLSDANRCQNLSTLSGA